MTKFKNIINIILQLSLFVALLCSFYIFVNALLLKENTYKNLYTTWQFPMLLAIYIDTIYYH
jgi:hypothetical protein